MSQEIKKNAEKLREKNVEAANLQALVFLDSVIAVTIYAILSPIVKRGRLIRFCFKAKVFVLFPPDSCPKFNISLITL